MSAQTHALLITPESEIVNVPHLVDDQEQKDGPVTEVKVRGIDIVTKVLGPLMGGEEIDIDVRFSIPLALFLFKLESFKSLTLPCFDHSLWLGRDRRWTSCPTCCSSSRRKSSASLTPSSDSRASKFSCCFARVRSPLHKYIYILHFLPSLAFKDYRFSRTDLFFWFGGVVENQLEADDST